MWPRRRWLIVCHQSVIEYLLMKAACFVIKHVGLQSNQIQITLYAIYECVSDEAIMQVLLQYHVG